MLTLAEIEKMNADTARLNRQTAIICVIAFVCSAVTIIMSIGHIAGKW